MLIPNTSAIGSELLQRSFKRWCWQNIFAKAQSGLVGPKQLVCAATDPFERPSLLGWRPLLLDLLGWRPLLLDLLGWRPSLSGWRLSLLGCRPFLLRWRPSLLGCESVCVPLRRLANQRRRIVWSTSLRAPSLGRSHGLGRLRLVKIFTSTTY